MSSGICQSTVEPDGDEQNAVREVEEKFDALLAEQRGGAIEGAMA